MNRPCIACHGNKYRPYSKLLIECEECNLVVAAAIPSDNELALLYQQDYFFGKEYFDYKADRGALEHNFKDRLRILSGLFTSNAKVVEVGCAYGFFLNLIRNRVVWHQGFDVSHDGVSFARDQLGVNATTDNFLTAAIDPKSINTVVMWDVVEHLPRPEEFLKKASEILAPGGHLVLTTGDISALVPRVRREKWRMIHPPTHIYYFNPKNITQLLDSLGLQVEKVTHPGVYRNMGSVMNQLVYNQKPDGRSVKVLKVAERIVRRTGLGKLNVPLNTFDIMEVVAVKRSSR